MDISKNESVREFERMDTLEKYIENDRDDSDSIRSEALGDDLPPGYFWSPRFLGAMAVGQTCCWKRGSAVADITIGFLSLCTIGIHLLDPADQRLDIYQRRYW